MEFLGKSTHTLPWQIIVEKFQKGNQFCSLQDIAHIKTPEDKSGESVGIDPNDNYAHQPNQPIVIKLPEETSNIVSLKISGINVAELIEGSWRDIGKASVNTQSNEINVTNGIEKEGFFRLSCTLKTQDGEPYNFLAYAIVCSDWKKDTLAFCRNLKEEIELNRDAQLIRSCIVISHFDYCMDMISGTPLLSDHILKALTDAVQSKQDFDAGRCSDLVIGLNKIRLKSFEGAPVEEFVVFVPDGYEDSKAWPVFLHVDNNRWATKNNYSVRSGWIDIWWHTVSYKELRWKEYKAIMKIIEEKLNIDLDRVYVDGDCGNGIAAIALALNYPDQWAECGASLGNSYRHLAGNALNLPLIFVKGTHSEEPLVGYYDFAVKCFQYYGCRCFKHSKTRNIAHVRGTLLPEEVRDRTPQRVLYTIESLGNPRAYWIKIEGREDENLPGTIDACVWGQTILVKTKNVDAYSLYFSQALIDIDRPIEIIENGYSLGLINDQIFTKRAKKYIDAVYIKNEHLHGPVWDAFADPYVVVWGNDSRDKKFSKVSEEAAKSISNGGLCFVDSNMPEILVNSHNLILVGTAESNLRLSKICKKLPVQIDQGQITAEGKCYDGRDVGLIIIYPNPINPQKYVVVFSGTSSKVIANISEVYSQMKAIRPADVGIFEFTDSGNIKWHIIEKFNTVWDWHSGWDQVLAVVDKKHPKWQWCQWVAKVIREQLETDVVVCEAPLMFKDSEPTEQITYRNLFNTFRNDWIVKIKLDGNDLRKLLMVPFNDISKREVDAPIIIDGVSFVKMDRGSEGSTLGINELENGKMYTIAIPEKLINGQRIGLVLKDYKIVGEAYLVPLLKAYLCRNKSLDIDAQLDGLKLDIF